MITSDWICSIFQASDQAFRRATFFLEGKGYHDHVLHLRSWLGTHPYTNGHNFYHANCIKWRHSVPKCLDIFYGDPTERFLATAAEPNVHHNLTADFLKALRKKCYICTRVWSVQRNFFANQNIEYGSITTSYTWHQKDEP